MKKIGLLFLACLAPLLLGLTPATPLWAFDGGDDGGFDGGNDDGDDEGEGHEQDQGEHHGQDGHHGADGNDQHGHHGGGHHHGHGGYGPGLRAGFGPGFGLGGYGFMPPFYSSPYYAYPQVVQPALPPVYIQQQNAAQPATEPQANYWHYCQGSAGYYPEIKECPDGWLQVPPQASHDNQQ